MVHGGDEQAGGGGQGEVVERRRAVLGSRRRRRGGAGEGEGAYSSGAGQRIQVGAGERRAAGAEVETRAETGRRQLSSSRKKYVHNQFKPDPR